MAVHICVVANISAVAKLGVKGCTLHRINSNNHTVCFRAGMELEIY